MSGRVYIGRLSYHVREKDVERFFKGYGRVTDILLKNGYGFVVSTFLVTLTSNAEKLLFVFAGI
jgi:hypothetical protein